MDRQRGSARPGRIAPNGAIAMGATEFGIYFAVAMGAAMMFAWWMD
jgi:hypothetical protein